MSLLWKSRSGTDGYSLHKNVKYETVESEIIDGACHARIAGSQGADARRECGDQPGEHNGAELFRHRGEPDVRGGRGIGAGGRDQSVSEMVAWGSRYGEGGGELVRKLHFPGGGGDLVEKFFWTVRKRSYEQQGVPDQ